MKKRELMKRLRAVAKSSDAELGFVREGANHEIWSLAGERLVIPRHSEINQRTAEGILKRAKEVVSDE